jgi:four helix bundle protein
MKKDLRERAYRFAVQAVHFVDSLPSDFSTSIIAKQLMRSSTSVGANLVESKGATSKKDFANFIGYSLKSANETLYWLCLLRDAKRIKNEAFELLYREAKELANILGASVITLKQKT